MVIKVDQLAKDLGYLGEVVIGYARLGMGSSSKVTIADLAQRKIYYYDENNSQVPAIAPVVEGINILTLNNPQLAGIRIRLGYPNYDHKRLYMLGFDTGEGLQAVGNLLPQEQQDSATLYPSVGNIINFRIMPQKSPDTTVFINPSPFYDVDGKWSFWGGESFDLADTIAALTSGQHQMAIVCLDVTVSELVVFTNVASDGTAADKGLFDWTTIATEIGITDVFIACGAVHLYEGQTEITEDDIYRSADPRAAFGKQGVSFTASIQTTNNTQTTIASILVDELQSVTITATITGAIDDYSAAIGGTLAAVVRRASGGSVTLVGSVTTDIHEDSAGSPTFTLDVDTGTETARIRVTGISAENWNWAVKYQKTVS